MNGANLQPSPSTFVINSRLLTDLFGYWPEFHDAEILDFSLSVVCAKPWISGTDSPLLDVKLELCDWNGSSASTTVEMRFRSIRNLEVSDFSYQNSVEEMLFNIETRTPSNGPGGLGPLFDVICVQIDANCGMTAAFECRTVEVISAIINKDAADTTSP